MTMARDELRDELADARSLVHRIHEAAGYDRGAWSQLLQRVKAHYINNWDYATVGIVLNWIGNNLSYANGLYRNNPADQSFHLRVIKNIEPKVPKALVENTAVAKILERKVALLLKQQGNTAGAGNKPGLLTEQGKRKHDNQSKKQGKPCGI